MHERLRHVRSRRRRLPQRPRLARLARTPVQGGAHPSARRTRPHHARLLAPPVGRRGQGEDVRQPEAATSGVGDGASRTLQSAPRTQQGRVGVRDDAAGRRAQDAALGVDAERRHTRPHHDAATKRGRRRRARGLLCEGHHQHPLAVDGGVGGDSRDVHLRHRGRSRLRQVAPARAARSRSARLRHLPGGEPARVEHAVGRVARGVHTSLRHGDHEQVIRVLVLPGRHAQGILAVEAASDPGRRRHRRRPQRRALLRHRRD